MSLHSFKAIVDTLLYLCQCHWHVTLGCACVKISKWKFHCQPNGPPFYKQQPCLFIPQEHGACFLADEDEVIQAAAQMNEVEFPSPGSTILAISDMQRTQSNGIK